MSAAEAMRPIGIVFSMSDRTIGLASVAADMSRSSLDNPIARAEIEKSIPIGRVASAADVAGPILFLVSDLARHLQGEIVNVNGGSVLAG